MWGVVLWLALALGPEAHASPSVTVRTPGVFELRWEGTPGCPDAEAVALAVHRNLGNAPLAEREEIVRAEGRIRPGEGDQLELELSIDDGKGPGTRILQAETCDELADAAALIIAIAIDPDAAALEKAEEPAGEEPVVDDEPGLVPAPPAGAAQPPREQSKESRPRANATPAASGSLGPEIKRTATRPRGPRSVHVRLGARAVGGADVGMTSPIGAAAGLAFGILLPKWRFDLTAVYLPPRQAEAEANPDIGGVLQLWAVGLRAAWVPRAGSVGFPIGAAIELGAMHGRGQGSALEATSANALWAAAVAGPGLCWAVLQSLALTLELDAVVPMTRPEFLTDRDTLVHRASGVGARMLGGIEVRWR